MLADLIRSPVPEPITLLIALGGIGLLVLWLFSRARRKGGNDDAP